MSKFFVPIPKQIWPTVVCTNACFHSFKCNCTVELLHNKLVENAYQSEMGHLREKACCIFADVILICYMNILRRLITT